MRGGAQAHLLRCREENSKDAYYVVKFQNNPQHTRVLVNELLGTRLARRLGLPAAMPAVVEVRAELIDRTEELCMQLGRGRAPCAPGLQFGSRYPGDPAETVVHDFLPEEPLRELENLGDFSGILVFDKWTCNTNGRQTIFLRGAARTRYQALMIDQGFCFNAGEWNFPDAPLRGLYARNRVYESVRGMESFEPWLDRLERGITEAVLDELASEIPPAWYGFDTDPLYQMLEQLLRRRKCVPDLLLEAKKSYRQPFPNWT
jgi:HipA-like kinase